MGTQILWLSDDQIDNFMEYAELTNNELPDLDAPQEERHAKIAYYLNIIETFDNDPKKAAKAFNNAIKKASKAADNLCVEMVAHIPKPTNKHFYSSFETMEDALEYEQQIKTETNIVFSETMQDNFYKKLQKFQEKQIDEWQTTH